MSTDVQQVANAEPLTNEEGKVVIDSWLNQRLRITIADSRSFEGWFKCVDRDCNIVLSGTEEFRDGSIPF
jgi:small nuclear ribonucleoprotein (snRNP)-like protein